MSGQFSLAYRFSVDAGQSWTVCDLDGNQNGYQLAQAGSLTVRGVQQDECALGLDNCHPNARCADLMDGFQCTCVPGFEGNGVNCADVDECRQNPCNAFEDCTNRPGGFECTCRPGFEDTGDGCVNINECENGIAQCPLRSSCVDRVPMQAPNSQRYECVCDPGFEKDGDVCVDIDECRTDPNVNCPANSRCLNMPGRYTCRCVGGFVKVGDECIPEADARCNEDADCIPSMAGCATTCGEDGQCIEFCGREGCPDPTEEGVTYVSQDSVQCRQIDLGGGLQCPEGTNVFSSSCGCGCLEEELIFNAMRQSLPVAMADALWRLDL